jgi:hypothetical protein
VIELFNAANEPGISLGYTLLALPPILWFAWRRLRGRPASLFVPLFAIVAFAVFVGIPVWDEHRISAMIATGQGLHTTRGVITNSWRIVSKERDFRHSSLRYRTTESEGFDIGDERFSWIIGRQFSNSAFSNSGKAPIRFVKGMQAEVTWFADPAMDNERRIVRLALGPANAVLARPVVSNTR